MELVAQRLSGPFIQYITFQRSARVMFSDMTSGHDDAKILITVLPNQKQVKTASNVGGEVSDLEDIRHVVTSLTKCDVFCSLPVVVLDVQVDSTLFGEV